MYYVNLKPKHTEALFPFNPSTFRAHFVTFQSTTKSRLQIIHHSLGKLARDEWGVL